MKPPRPIPPISESRHMNPIARRIARGFLRRTAATILIVNLLLLAAAFGIFVVSAERAALGSSWTPVLRRELVLPEGGGLLWRLENARIAYSVEGGETQFLDAGAFVTLVLRVSGVLLAAEALVLFGQYRGERRRVMRL
ncbi:MAG TPA: hypothetical protein VLA21_08460, partial [Candidatus Limnocylindria bacterium]|nr:hypothetical protein [Candidatus Limnocylindria bacterium]